MIKYLVIAMLLIPSLAFGADHYIRDGATGSAPCNSDGWNAASACDSLPATLTRGDTYYIGDGSYSSYTFDDSESSTSVIYIKKATESAHGTETGWSSAYGNGSATFGIFQFTDGYYDIDGAVGQWASDMTDYIAYGIKVETNTTSTGSKVIRLGGSGAPVTNINLRHLELSFTNTPRSGSWAEGMDGIWGYGSDWLITYCWLHDIGRTGFLPVGADDVILEYSVFERNGQAQVAENFEPSEHSEMSMMQPDADRITWRYNYIRDWRSTGGLIFYTENDDIEIYGNVFWDTGYYSVPSEANDSNGAINGRTAGVGYIGEVYNNTFYNLRYGARIMTMGTWESRDTKNNIFYNSWLYGSGNPGDLELGGTHDYNWFYDSGTQSETNIQNGSADAFSDTTTGDFTLTYATDDGAVTSFDTDLLGNTRGADGVWDRGAFEFESGAFSITITTPTSSSTYSTSTTPITVGGVSSYSSTIDSVTWANSEASTSGTATGTTSWSDSIALVDGANTIRATVNAADASTEGDTLTVTYTPPEEESSYSLGTFSGSGSIQ